MPGWLTVGVILLILILVTLWRIRTSRTSPDRYQPRHKQSGDPA